LTTKTDTILESLKTLSCLKLRAVKQIERLSRFPAALPRAVMMAVPAIALRAVEKSKTDSTPSRASDACRRRSSLKAVRESPASVLERSKALWKRAPTATKEARFQRESARIKRPLKRFGVQGHRQVSRFADFSDLGEGSWPRPAGPGGGFFMRAFIVESKKKPTEQGLEGGTFLGVCPCFDRTWVRTLNTS